MIYKNKLKYLRDRNNTKAIDIANYLNISKSLYSEYENETKTIPTKYLCQISNYFNCSIDYIFDFASGITYQNKKTLKDLNYKIVGERIKSIRIEKQLTQRKLGKVTGCSYGTIAGYEAGRYLISVPVLYKICKTYNISADYLLGKTDTPKYLK